MEYSIHHPGFLQEALANIGKISLRISQLIQVLVILDSNYVYFNIGIHGLDSTSDFIVTTNNQILIDECRLQLELPRTKGN